MGVQHVLECLIFQSTLSVRRATPAMNAPIYYSDISIHALRKESDSTTTRLSVVKEKFQSTLSVRRATKCRTVSASSWIFQSTLSVRRATVGSQGISLLYLISIHALRKESDTACRFRCSSVLHFNPRSP